MDPTTKGNMRPEGALCPASSLPFAVPVSVIDASVTLAPLSIVEMGEGVQRHRAGVAAGQAAGTRAVTSISMRIASSISRASIMVAAGRAWAKAALVWGQSLGKSVRSGRI